MSRMIHIVDDDDQVRESLGLLLETSGHVVTRFVSGDAYVAARPELEGAVVILDVRMPGRDGVETLEHIRKRSARTPVIMISGHGDIPLAVRAMRAGADDFVEKPFVASRILAAIDRLGEVADGKVENDSIENKKMEDDAAIDMSDPLEALTPREREVALAVADGKPNKIVAHELGISIRTVETHRARLMSKLGLSSLPELVRLVIARSPA
ncbi:MAG: response regulator [Litorimonas sp.]